MQTKSLLGCARSILKVKHSEARWVELTEHALKIELIAAVDTVAWSECYAVREDLLLRTLKIIEQAGTRPAVPVRITYLAHDDGLDTALIAAAKEPTTAPP